MREGQYAIATLYVVGLLHSFFIFRRYEMLWLPLVAANFKRSKELAAPLDIAWVWHVHMLSPEAYAAVSSSLGNDLMDGPRGCRGVFVH